MNRTSRLLRTTLASCVLLATARAVDTTTVFNEVMYHPATPADTEWIEFRNEMAINMDLTGWHITGGVNFAFPPNTTILAGGYIVIAANPAALPGVNALGPWTGSLDNSGESLELKNASGRVMDNLSYNDRGEWPAGADGSGMSLARRKPNLARSEPANWEVSRQRGGSPGTANDALQLGPPQTVFATGDPWLFNDTSGGLATGWSSTSYVAGTGGWLSGNGVLAFEDAVLPATVGTVLASPATHPTGTYYFQKQFNFTGIPAATQLTLHALLDDGAVIYLNGQEVARQQMPGIAITATTAASAETGNAAFVDIPIPATYLVNGSNTMSVEVHQAGKLIVPGGGGGALTLVQTGGVIFATDYSRQAGATPFAKDTIPAAPHAIAGLNNGTYGNSSSWIGNSLNSFCGVSFGGTVNLGSVAWGRDNTGSFSDRCAGLYTLEYTQVASPGTGTAATGNPATGWAVIGTITYPASYSLRHAYTFTPVNATGIRLTVPGNSFADGACIDELEAGPAITPPAPVFKLMATSGTLDNSLDLALTGTAFAKDVLTGYAAHSIPHLNDGIYGNPNSWIGNSLNSFAGISFPSARLIGRIAWGRDNTGTYADRTDGTYTVQYTTVANPTGATPDASWTTIGTISIDSSIGSPSLRHLLEFSPVNATGIRVITPGNGIGSGACIDELELYAPVTPDVVWGASLQSREIVPPPDSLPIEISEIGGSNDGVWKVELRNKGTSPVDVGAYVLASSADPLGGYTLPSQILAPGGFLVLDQSMLGFRPGEDQRLFLFTPSRNGLADSAVVKSTVRARSGVDFLAPTAATFGSANTFSLQSDIVINEVMYHFAPNSGPPVTENVEEWIELYNKGAASVALGGWSLDGGVGFTIPAGTTLSSGGYLVIARDAAALSTKWPEQATRIIGNWSGSLSNSGDRIVLRDASGNPADEVHYFTGGAWSDIPDGGGASLELRDPRADNSNGAAWGASDQSASTSWQTVTYTMNSGQTFGQTQWNEFRIGMLDAGECLVDDVSVIRVSNGQQHIQGGDFSSLANKWRMLGNHGTSTIEPEPGNPGNMVLHVRAAGPFSFNHNHIETSFVGNTALVDGQSYTVSFRARWLSGSNQLNTRGYYSRLARTTDLTLPSRIGTPGAVNSRAVANLGPTLGNLAHSPVVPNPTEPVTVTAIANDPDGMGAVTLNYVVYAGGTTTPGSAPMTANGSVYSGQVPAQAAGAIVQFYVTASDVPGAVITLPAAGANSHALYIVNDGQISPVSAHELRIVMLPADTTSLLATLNRLSDARIGATAIYQRSEVFYDVGVRLQGTAAGRIRDGEAYPGYDIGFAHDHLFRGVHDSVNIDRSGRGPVVRGQDEIYVKHLFNRSGVPCSYDDLVYLISPAPNNIHTGTAILQMAGYEGEFVESQFGGDGGVFNLDGTYEPSTTTGTFEALKNPVPLATQLSADFTNLGADKEQYRGQLEPRAGKRRDDFTGLIPFCQAMADSGVNYATNIRTRLDVDEWMRVAAIYSLWGIADCYMNAGFPHNLRVHVPSDGLNVRALAWDMDFVSNSATNSAPILAGGNLLRIINNVPGARHTYYGHLHELCNTTFTSAYYTPWLTHYGSVVGQSMSGAANYIEARRSSVLSQLPANVTFAITTSGGADFSVNTATTPLAGSGWVNVREIRRSDTGAKLDVAWTSDTAWTTTIGLVYGPNPITLVAYDGAGVQVGTDSVTITSTLNVGSVRDALRITEVHYNPAPPATSGELAASTDKDDFEFIEVRNISNAYSIDTTGCKFTNGVDVTLGAMLGALESAVIVRNSAAFVARYGNGPRIIGTYGPADSLSNNGETITLVDSTGAVIQSFTYGDSLPWPANADGAGYSLIAISPGLALDRDLASSWRASTAIGGNPGTADSTTFTGVPTGDADSDALNAFLEYALGTSDNVSAPAPISLVREAAGTLKLTFTRALNADDVALTIESSSGLLTWTPAAATLVSRIQSGTILTETWRVTPGAGAAAFLRLKASTR